MSTEETTPLADDLNEVSSSLFANSSLSLVVQRSRAYVKRSKRSRPRTPQCSQREPQVAQYNIRESYGSLLDLMTVAFNKEVPLFSLPMYNRYKFAHDPEKWDVLEIGRSVGPVTLIRTQFLKRFESSIASFQSSCFAMFRTILAFLEVHVESDEEVARLDKWRNDNQERITNVARQEKDLFSFMEDGDDFLDEKDFKRWQDDRLSREDFKVDEMIEECYSDLEQLKRFLLETESFTPGSDDKLRKLIRLLKTNDLKGQKVIIFTEFSDTAKYLQAQLREKGFRGWRW